MKISFYQIMIIIFVALMLFGDLSNVQHNLKKYSNKLLKYYRKKGSWTPHLWFWKPTLYLMSYSPNYLTEIKNRLALTILTGSSCILVNFLYLDDLLYIIIKPLLVKNNDFYFIFTDVSEPFYINIKLILYTSSQIFYLVLCSQFILFLKPGLYKNEYEYIKYLSVYSCILFLIYFKISYSLLIPWSFSFFFYT